MSCVLCSELTPHFSLASESDPAEQEDVDDDTEQGINSTHQSRAPPVAAHDDTVATSGVSTLSSTVSHESHNAQRSVSMELGRMKLETNRFAEIRHVYQPESFNYLQLLVSLHVSHFID